jgi:hypothetical protein
VHVVGLPASIVTTYQDDPTVEPLHQLTHHLTEPTTRPTPASHPSAHSDSHRRPLPHVDGQQLSSCRRIVRASPKIQMIIMDFKP